MVPILAEDEFLHHEGNRDAYSEAIDTNNAKRPRSFDTYD
jgi:hypothetical protein